MPDETHARVEVGCGQALGPLRRIWASFGYDEINWTATPNGRRNLNALRGFMETPYYVRAHNLYTSGTGLGLPHWSSGNVYHEDAAGRPRYEWSVFDAAFDAWVATGCRPIVELGFCPRALVPTDAEASLPFRRMPSTYSAYEAGLWAWPPRDPARFAELVAATVRRAVDRYGAEQVSFWYWELWNEPDISYWQGTHEQYCDLYERCVEAAAAVLPNIRFGGPATTGSGVDWLTRFLEHCNRRDVRLDFVSFHTKGASFAPWRSYGVLTPEGVETPQRQSPSTSKIVREVRANLEAIDQYPRFREVPVLVDECDASVPAHWGIYDNANFGYRNSEYYPVFQCQQMKKLLDLAAPGGARVHLATTWSWYFEGERYFEGTRALFTAGNVAKPVLNAYRMLARLPDTRVALNSDSAASLDSVGEDEVDGIAAIGDGVASVLVWHHCDDQYTSGTVRVDLLVRDLWFDGPLAVRHFRVDAGHSNSFAAWVQAGRPQDPDQHVLAHIRDRGNLEECAAPLTERRSGAELAFTFELPLHGASLIEITRA